MTYKLLMEIGVEKFNSSLAQLVLLGWTPLPESLNTISGNGNNAAVHSILLQKTQE